MGKGRDEGALEMKKEDVHPIYSILSQTMGGRWGGKKERMKMANLMRRS